MLQTDAGACLLPLEEGMGYAESSLLEPWGCVMAAYTQRRRLSPKKGGTMWMVGQPGTDAPFTFSTGCEAPTTVVTDRRSPLCPAADDDDRQEHHRAQRTRTI